MLYTLVSLGQITFAQNAASKGYLGIYAKSNSNVLDQTNAFAGITVTKVIENSPGAAAGVREGDVILQANGKDLSDPNQLLGLAESLPIGSAISLKIERDAAILNLEAHTVARLLPAEDLKSGAPKTYIENHKLGFEFIAAPDELTIKYKLEPKSAIQVKRLAANGPMAKGGIKPESLITAIDNQPIRSPEGFIEYLGTLSELRRVSLSVITPEGKKGTKHVWLRLPPRRTKKMRILPFFNYSREPNKTIFSIPILLSKRERIENSTTWQILWFIKFQTGASDELLEVESN
ncbi:PDZ domain-containing protein [Candidatus Sumerlaeota bacterium]|nr:PDZ domain-containing protein [Candidatus Sumerlaeota bacterium]